MRLMGPVAATLIILCFAGGPARADVACRPNTLGNQFCPVTPPPPRPIYRKPVQALDRVMREPKVGSQAPTFVPSRETGRLGNQTITDQDLRTGICRKDTLGNLLCR
jgi:hypothetical protein